MIFLRRELEKRNHENTRNAENFHHFKFPSLRTTQEPGASHALFSMPNALEGLSQLFGLRGVQRNSKEGGARLRRGRILIKMKSFFVKSLTKCPKCTPMYHTTYTRLPFAPWKANCQGTSKSTPSHLPCLTS